MPQFHKRSGMAAAARMCGAARRYFVYGADAPGTVKERSEANGSLRLTHIEKSQGLATMFVS
jgi:hypothetical protein